MRGGDKVEVEDPKKEVVKVLMGEGIWKLKEEKMILYLNYLFSILPLYIFKNRINITTIKNLT